MTTTTTASVNSTTTMTTIMSSSSCLNAVTTKKQQLHIPQQQSPSITALSSPSPSATTTSFTEKVSTEIRMTAPPPSFHRNTTATHMKKLHAKKKEIGKEFPEFVFCGTCCATPKSTEAAAAVTPAPVVTPAPAVTPEPPVATAIATAPSVRSSLYVGGICCATEVPMVKSVLRDYERVSIAIATRTVYVTHTEPIDTICMVLEANGFPASILRNGHTAHATQPLKNKTTTLKNKTTLLKNKRSFDSDDSASIALETSDFLKQQEQQPQHLQINDDDDSNNDTTPNTSSQPEPTTKLSHSVILSGICWCISMVGAMAADDSMYKYLNYIGLGAVYYGLPPIVEKAYRTIHHRKQLDANVMMVVAALGAVVLQEFDEAASVSFLFSISEYLEYLATTRARVALQSLSSLRPEYAHVLVQTDDTTTSSQETNAIESTISASSPLPTETTTSSSDNTTNSNNAVVKVVPADSVAVGTMVLVRTGDKVAADCIVVSGVSAMDQSSLTGESQPVPVGPGDTVPGGVLNVGGTACIVKTTATSADSTVSRLVRFVEEASTHRSHTENIIDNFARSYTPFVLLTACVLATGSWIGGFEMGRYWTYNALILVVISCPCALTISTPVTYAAALAATAQHGVVCKGGASLETLGHVSTVIFDKTGTLTQGDFHVQHLECVAGDRKEMVTLLAAMEAPSSHPLSTCLVRAAEKEGIVCSTTENESSSTASLPIVQQHTVLQGEGVEGSIHGRTVFVGNQRLFERIGMYGLLEDATKHRISFWNSYGGTVGFIGIVNVGIIGCYCVTDVIRPEAKTTIETLQKRRDDMNVVMLSGDSNVAAVSVAKQVGIESVYSELLPENKLHIVGSLKSPPISDTITSILSGLFFPKRNKILFCGDGLNDAPALSVADVGVAIGDGASVAMEMSDVTLMDSKLSKLPYLLDMGDRTVSVIRQNIGLSLFCKGIVVALTFHGSMTLFYAISSDVGVMLLVTMNGMKLLPYNNKNQYEQHEDSTESRTPQDDGLVEEEKEVGILKKFRKFSWNTYYSGIPTTTRTVETEIV